MRFELSDTSWRLSVSDNGVGMNTSLTEPPAKSGLGTSIIEALTRQLNGCVTTSDASPGTTVFDDVSENVVTAQEAAPAASAFSIALASAPALKGLTERNDIRPERSQANVDRS